MPREPGQSLRVKAAPGNASANILLGNALAGLNDTSRAVKQMEQAISLDPSYAPAWTALGAVQFLGGSRARRRCGLPEGCRSRAAISGRATRAGELSVGKRRHVGCRATLRRPRDGRHERRGSSVAGLLYLSTRRAIAGRAALQGIVRGARRSAGACGLLHRRWRIDKARWRSCGVEAGSDKGDARAATLRIAGSTTRRP